jgi:putative ABC transport system permease protein
MRVVTPGYFDTLGIALRAGRDISESDTVDSPYVAVVSESFVRRYWPNQDPIGRKFHFDFADFPFAAQDRTVVGVVNDVRFRGLERRNEPQVYLANRQLPDRTLLFYAPKELVIRASGDNAALISAARKIIHKADPEMPIPAVRPLQEVVERQTTSRTTQLRLIGVFAVLALLLAAIGIHGLLSFAVGQRSAEFGLRIALGAPSGEILRMVLREGTLLAGIGAVFGLILSYAAGRSIQALLAGVSPLDGATMAVAGLVAVAMTLSGSLIPAIRAMRTDPTTILRG